MRLFYLRRDQDPTGVSGTGIVAEGVEFYDGTVALRWRTEHSSTAIYQSMDDIIKIHGHGGKTTVVFTDAAHHRQVPPSSGAPVWAVEDRHT